MGRDVQYVRILYAASFYDPAKKPVFGFFHGSFFATRVRGSFVAAGAGYKPFAAKMIWHLFPLSSRTVFAFVFDLFAHFLIAQQLRNFSRLLLVVVVEEILFFSSS